MNATSSNDDLTAREIYCRAVEEPDPEKRLQLVQSLCDGRPDVLQRVQRLLDARQQSDTGLLARVSDAWQAARSDAAKEFSGGGPSLDSSETAASRQNSPRFVGQQFGPYNLLEVLGEGGMGTVYRAKQLVPMEREVALKVIKSESHAPESHARESFARESYAQGAIARFAQERQSMALMQHPNIASVFDGGETDDGRHYLVMELVRGVPVDRYCEENDLPLEQRLALFMELARAIQHAHSKDIIHRDLKPSNVLVTLVDGKPMVKVIDFGIAKSIALQLEIDAERTRTGQLLGTPLYQAPEQLDASGSIADVRCDVYALGVILYKLLTGTTPVDRNVVAQTGYDGLMRKLTEQEYDAPSARAQALVEAEETRPAQGFLDSPIARQSELDWIVLNALHPEPNDRYSSVARLLDDLESFARREPISVGPPRPIGKRSRFSRKSVVLAALLVFGLAAATYVSVASLSNPGLEPDRQGLVPPGPAPAPREIERPGDGRPEPSSASSIALWRETAQLQLALTAFREANYSAIPESFVTRTESSRNDPAASAAYERFDLRRLLQDAAVPQCTLQIEGTADVQAAAFSAQSQRLVVASKTGQIRLYSVNDGGLTRAPKIIGTHPGRVDAIAISPDGSRAATGTNVLWIWDLDRGEILHKGPGYDAGVEAITWSPDGQSIAVGSRYAFAWVGDSSGNELFNIPNNHRH
ncbi:MAG TPA: hypothetical protein DDW52_11980, partial [Planctomycetaceae bacterium]|nr:hypothetical protein [Planctomycetaceae bacterium]